MCDQKRASVLYFGKLYLFICNYLQRKNGHQHSLYVLCVFILETCVMIPEKTELLPTHSSAFSLFRDVTELFPSSWNISEKGDASNVPYLVESTGSPIHIA